MASAFGSEEPAFDKGPPEEQLLFRLHPHLFLWSGTSVIAAPSSRIFHLSSPPPLPSTPSTAINENQKEGEWGLERVIPFLFIGLHQRPRGKECGLYPEARSKALRGAGSWLGLACDPSCLNLPSCTIR